MSEKFKGMVEIADSNGNVTGRLDGQREYHTKGYNAPPPWGSDEKSTSGSIDLHDSAGKLKLHLGHTPVVVPVVAQPGQPPVPVTYDIPGVALYDAKEKESLRLTPGKISVGSENAPGSIYLYHRGEKFPADIIIDAASHRIIVTQGDNRIYLSAEDGIQIVHKKDRIKLEPTADCGRLRIYDKAGNAMAYLGDSNGFAELALGGAAGKFPGRIALRKGNYEDQIVLDATTGDILLTNADCAEEFDVADDVEPGTVLVLDDHPGRLRTSENAYDSKVAGVVSGAGSYRPGIVLDRQGLREGRHPVALVGKVFCKVDATRAPVRPGSLLTTSESPGHAMVAVDRSLAFGAVLGKALQGLEHGFGLVPILVGLQ